MNVDEMGIQDASFSISKGDFAEAAIDLLELWR